MREGCCHSPPPFPKHAQLAYITVAAHQLAGDMSQGAGAPPNPHPFENAHTPPHTATPTTICDSCNAVTSLSHAGRYPHAVAAKYVYINECTR